MNTTLLSRAALSVLASLALGSLPLFADHPAKVTLEIKTDAGKTGDAAFVETQSQIIRKNEILFPVIDQLGLVEKLGKPRAEVAHLLSQNLKIQFNRDSSLAEVIVSQPDQNLAADIVTAIAKEYQKRRISDLKRTADAQLGEMKNELAIHVARVQGLFTQAAILRQKTNVADPDPESINVIVTGPGFDALSTLQTSVDEQTAHVAQLAARVEVLAKLKPEEFLDALGPLKIEDPVIAQVQPQLVLAKAEEAGLLAGGVPEKDPRVSALRAKIDIYAQALAHQRESILRGHGAVLKIERKTLADAKAQLDLDRERALAGKGDIQKYVEAKSEYLLARSLMQVIEQRYAAARFDNQLSFEPVKIWEWPERAAK